MLHQAISSNLPGNFSLHRDVIFPTFPVSALESPPYWMYLGQLTWKRPGLTRRRPGHVPKPPPLGPFNVGNGSSTPYSESVCLQSSIVVFNI